MTANIIDERGYSQVFRPTPAQKIRLRRRVEALAEEMDLPESANKRGVIRILEIGCGMGELAHQLAVLTGAHVTGVDLSARFIEHAAATHRHPNLTFAVVDLNKTSPASEQDQYHYIVGNGILHHLYHQLDEILGRLNIWLHPGGRVIFWEPNLHNPYIRVIFSLRAARRWARLEPDEMAFTARFIREKLQDAGFENIKASPRDFLLPNTPEFLIKPVTSLGGLLERTPLLRYLAQSVFVSANRPLL